VSHTHVDPDHIEVSVAELVSAGVTTTMLDLTIDDGDFRSGTPTFLQIPQADTQWGDRFQARLAVLIEWAAEKPADALKEKGAQVVIVHHLSDIPVSPEDVQRFRTEHKIALVIASEGSNQIEAPNGRPQFGDSIAKLREKGWLSTALIHQLGAIEAGHRLLTWDGKEWSWSPTALKMAMDLNSDGILIDLPHLTHHMLSTIIPIATARDRPVMISHENVAGFVLAHEVSAGDIVASGRCTGLIGAHSQNDYVNLPPWGDKPTNADAYARSIDAGRTSLNMLRFADGQWVDGSRHLALGLDWYWDGQEPNKTRWAGRAKGDELKKLVRILIGPPYNYSDDAVSAILGMNMVRIMSASLNEDTSRYLTSCR
jgi:microsomal dipeptidase-like Zn-dependent dipeptidase